MKLDADLVMKLIVKQLSVLLAEDPKILGAYVFGSVAKGNGDGSSDLDLAVVVRDKRKVNLKQIYKLLSKVSFSMNLDLNVIDVHSSPLLLWQVVRDGKVVYRKDELELVNFESEVMKRYYDTQHLRNIYHQRLHDRFITKGL